VLQDLPVDRLVRQVQAAQELQEKLGLQVFKELQENKD
jgi:hypothetical protein